MASCLTEVDDSPTERTCEGREAVHTMQTNRVIVRADDGWKLGGCVEGLVAYRTAKLLRI